MFYRPNEWEVELPGFNSFDCNIPFPTFLWPQLERTEAFIQLVSPFIKGSLGRTVRVWLMFFSSHLHGRLNRYNDLRWWQKRLVTNAFSHLISRTIVWVKTFLSCLIDLVKGNWAGIKVQCNVHLYRHIIVTLEPHCKLSFPGLGSW